MGGNIPVLWLESYYVVLLGLVDTDWNSIIHCFLEQAKQETVDKVCSIVKKQLALADGAVVTGESKFTELGADSLDTVIPVYKKKTLTQEILIITQLSAAGWDCDGPWGGVQHHSRWNKRTGHRNRAGCSEPHWKACDREGSISKPWIFWSFQKWRPSESMDLVMDTSFIQSLLYVQSFMLPFYFLMIIQDEILYWCCWG